MTPEAGQQIAHYRLVEKIGEGGMGVVWKAVDTKLGREAAIKMLAQDQGWDPERSARLEREARMLAALNHPNIAGIHGLEEHDGGRFLAMEFVPGDTLADLLDRRSLPPDEAVRICSQIAEAMEAAHEQGILHRDLKPANVKITPDGIVKVLDFGLARIGDAPGSADASLSPTITGDLTRAGLILGTAAYMSPEQARGRPLDKRTDIWSFGCILFECLSVRRPYEGPTIPETLVRILEKEPDWDLLPASTPRGVRNVLRRCLQKEPRLRLRDVGDARILLSEVEDQPGESEAGAIEEPAVSSGLRSLLVGAILLVIGAALAFLWLQWNGPAAGGSTALRAELLLPADGNLRFTEHNSVAISRDGRMVAAVVEGGSEQGLYLRDLETGEARLVPDSADAVAPFFSPDGAWIAFFREVALELRKAPVAGGNPVLICGADTSPREGTWGDDGTIVFARGFNTGLSTVPAAGGEPRALTDLRPGEKSHRLPEFLPDGRHVVFTLATSDISSYEDAQIAVLSMETGEISILIEGGTDPRYLAPGMLLYAREDGLYAAPFDPGAAELQGAPVRVVENVAVSPSQGYSAYSVSASGTLVFADGGAGLQDNSLVRVDREGNATPLPVPAGVFQNLSLSPDGGRLLFGLDGANVDSWVYDLERETMTRLTRGWDNELPIWNHDGGEFFFTSGRTGFSDLHRQAVTAGAKAERIVEFDGYEMPLTVTPDGQWLAFLSNLTGRGFDIRLVALDGSGQLRDLFDSPALEPQASFSPDGRWLAYTSDTSGDYEVYVVRFPEATGQYQVSNRGGTHPIWSSDGHELFYIEGERLMAVDVRGGSTFGAGKPRRLFELTGLPGMPYMHLIELTRDGEFLMPDFWNSRPIRALHLNVGWHTEAERLLATSR